MKTFLFLLVLFFLGSYDAQGNLQFNQVLLLNAASNNSTQWTVPAGKTWKIEAMGTYTSTMYVYLNNNIAFEFIGDFNNNNGAYYRGSDAPAIWLPAGTVLGHFTNNASAFRWFSIIEFNIIP
jgi:beta-galactosidase/beta-glucuronidase